LGGGVDMATRWWDNGGGRSGGGAQRRWEKIGSKYQDVVATGIRANEQVTPSLGQNQFLLALFIDSSTLYSRLIQSLV
jgi:hypothetical protein